MIDNNLTIGRLARETGCKVQTIRYYEQISLMPHPLRTTGNQRRYGAGHVARLAFIRHGRELGFSLDAIREFLSLADQPDRPCEAADLIARAQLEAVESRIARLNSLKVELERMIAQCKGKRIAECRIIEVLANHGECIHENHAKPAQGHPPRPGA